MRATNTHCNTLCNTHSNRLEQVGVLGDKESIKALSLLHTNTTKRSTHAQVRMFEEASDQHKAQLQAKSDEVAMLKKEVCVCCSVCCRHFFFAHGGFRNFQDLSLFFLDFHHFLFFENMFLRRFCDVFPRRKHAKTIRDYPCCTTQNK